MPADEGRNEIVRLTALPWRTSYARVIDALGRDLFDVDTDHLDPADDEGLANAIVRVVNALQPRDPAPVQADGPLDERAQEHLRQTLLRVLDLSATMSWADIVAYAAKAKGTTVVLDNTVQRRTRDLADALGFGEPERAEWRPLLTYAQQGREQRSILRDYLLKIATRLDLGLSGPASDIPAIETVGEAVLAEIEKLQTDAGKAKGLARQLDAEMTQIREVLADRGPAPDADNPWMKLHAPHVTLPWVILALQELDDLRAVIGGPAPVAEPGEIVEDASGRHAFCTRCKRWRVLLQDGRFAAHVGPTGSADGLCPGALTKPSTPAEEPFPVSGGEAAAARVREEQEDVLRHREAAAYRAMKRRALEVLAEVPVVPDDHAARGTARRILGFWPDAKDYRDEGLPVPPIAGGNTRAERTPAEMPFPPDGSPGVDAEQAQATADGIKKGSIVANALLADTQQWAARLLDPAAFPTVTANPEPVTFHRAAVDEIDAKAFTGEELTDAERTLRDLILLGNASGVPGGAGDMIEWFQRIVDTLLGYRQQAEQALAEKGAEW